MKLTLPIKKEWFDLIKAGIKKEEYRKIYGTPGTKGELYYPRLLLKEWWTNLEECDNPNKFFIQKDFDTIEFRNGYRADSPKIQFKNPKIRIGTGKPEWGAEPFKLYFIITWEN